MKDLNVRPETIQRRKDRQQHLWHWPLDLLSKYASEVSETKAKILLGVHQLQSFCKVKETSNAKMQHTKWEEIFVNNTSNKELVCKISKANINLSILNTNYPTADGQKTWMDFVSVKTSRWPPDTRTDTQRHPSSGKCKPKPQWDVTWQPTEWLKLTTQETTDVGEAMEKGEPPYTPRGHVNRCSYCGKQSGVSSRS